VIDAAVVDASVAVKWVVREEHSDVARLLASARLEAPDLLPVECANIIWKKVRLGDLGPRDAAGRLDLLLRAPVAITASRELLDRALQIALDLKHPVYDCVYLALAQSRKLPLVTADRRLVSAVGRRPNLGIRVEFLADLGRQTS
jgi:predicted nucleic acid-binding protein